MHSKMETANRYACTFICRTTFNERIGMDKDARKLSREPIDVNYAATW